MLSQTLGQKYQCISKYLFSWNHLSFEREFRNRFNYWGNDSEKLKGFRNNWGFDYISCKGFLSNKYNNYIHTTQNAKVELLEMFMRKR